jgi:hypothetical protein
MATELTGRGHDDAQTRWRLGPGGILLIGLADFCAAVGAGNVLLHQAAAVWFFTAAVLLLVGIASGD